MMRRQRNTKIVATLGPATSTRQDVLRLFEAGADVFSMDMRFGTHADHLARYQMVREVEQLAGRPIGVMMDLQGPRLQLGSFRQGDIELIPGQSFTFDLSPGLGDHSRIHLPHQEVYEAVSPGDVLFLDDGTVKLRVESVTSNAIRTRVECGGRACDGSYLKAPYVHLPIQSLTQKDQDDLAFGMSIGVDWVALSFVQNEWDVRVLRDKLGKANAPKIVAKIEKPSALEHLDGIIEAADAVMVCRSELGVELAVEDVPIAQRRIVRACRAHGKPVVIATQMLDSMVHQGKPSRAEANDAASVVYDGADAVLLAAETATGKFPMEAVRVMDRIVRRIETAPGYTETLESELSSAKRRGPAYAIGAAIRTAADILPVSFTAAYTESGGTCLAVAHVRPRSPILGLSPSLATARMLSLVWGVYSLHMADALSAEAMYDKALGVARRDGFAQEGRPFVMVAGMPVGTRGATNLMQIGWV